MKYKHLAMIMGVMITATSVGSTATAFAADSKTESTKEAGDTAEDTTNSSDENTERLRKLTENYVVSNEKIKSALGIDRMPVRAADGIRKTIKSFEE